MAKIFIVFSLLYISTHCSSLSPELEKQIADARKMVQEVCQPKFKITDAQIQTAMTTKLIPTEKSFKCFIQCTLEMTGMMIRNKPNFEQARRQVEIFLPDDMKIPILKAMDVCSQKVQVAKDGCETAYNIAMCFQEEHPDSPF